MRLIADIFTFLTFFFLPFLGGNHLPLFYISIDRFWIETLFSVFLIISVMLRFMRSDKNSVDFISFALYFLPFAILSAISLSYSWNRFSTLLSLSILVWAIGGVYLFLQSPKKEICLAGLVAGATMSSVSAILQHLILFPNLMKTFSQGMYASLLREQAGIPFASYSYHNILGGYLAFILPLAIYFSVYKKSIVSTIASSIIIVGVVLTSTRIGLGIVVLCLLASFVLFILSKNKGGFIKVIGIVALCAVISISVLYGMKKTSNVGVQGIISYKAKNVYSDLSTMNTRTDIWKNGLSAFRNAPIVGYGAGAFEYAYRKYFDGNSYTGVAHSLVIKTFVELGVIGLLCLFFYLGGVLGHVKNFIKDPLGRFIAMSAAAGLLFGLVDFSFDVASHVITFFVLSAFFFSTNSERTKIQSVFKSKYMRVFVFSIVLVLVMVTFLFSSKASLFSRSIENGDLMMENGFTLEALYSYRDAIEIMPFSNEGYMKTAYTLVQLFSAEKDDKLRSLMMKELSEYLTTLEKSSDRDSELYFILGQAYSRKGDHERARLYFDRALYYYPLSAYYIFEIASYCYLRGRLDDAQKLIDVFRPYGEKYRSSNDPRGFMIYKIHDLEATIQYQKRNLARALQIAKNNYNDAEKGVYVITSVRAKEYVTREKLLGNLSERVKFFESECHGLSK
jgi:O-antigen ligase